MSAYAAAMEIEAVAALGRAGPLPGAVLVELDDAAEHPAVVIRAAVEVLATHPGLSLGVATEPLAGRALEIAQSLTVTVATSDPGVVGLEVADVEVAVAELLEAFSRQPDACRLLVQTLRNSGALKASQGLWAESMAYSTLLGGGGFRAWRKSRPVRRREPSVDAVRVDRRDQVLRVVLDRPRYRNALDASARAALSAALEVAIADRALSVELSGTGPDFCAGGDLDEFGSATDLAAAHVMRLEHGPAPRMQAVGGRTSVFMHGNCIGAGVELAAFAHRVVAAPGTRFRLPEVGMGLIPGAGGTVSVSRRIGRWRAAWWMLTGAEVDLDTAVAWGLVDEVR